MKIYTKVEYLWDKDLQEYVEVSSEGYDYEGPVAQAGGGGSKQPSHTTSTTVPWSGQQPSLENLFGSADQWYNTGSADTSAVPLYQQAAQQYTGVVPELADYSTAIRNANLSMAGGDLLNPASNPAFQQYLDLSNQAISKQLNEQILPNLDLGALNLGGFGSTRQGIAQGQAAGSALDAIQRNTAALTDAAYGRGIQGTLGAQSLAPGIAQMAGLPGAFTEAGAGLTDVAGNYADRAALDRLKAYQMLVGGGGYGSSSATTGTGTRTGGIPGALGGTLAGAGLGSALTAGEGALLAASWNPYIIGAGALLGYLG